MSDERQMPLEEPVVREWSDDTATIGEYPVLLRAGRFATEEHNASIRHLRAEVEALTKRAHTLENTAKLNLAAWKTAKAAKEASEARAKECRENELAAIEEMQKAEARAKRLVEWMREHADHPTECASSWAGNPCDCGLPAALAPPAQDANEKETG